MSDVNENMASETLTPKHLTPKRRRAKSSFSNTPAKPGMTKNKIGLSPAKYMEKYYEQRRLLTVPKEIEEQHPDKHFVFVNMPKMHKNSFYHPLGYKLFRTDDPNAKALHDKFNDGVDNFVHRNEMCLAYISKEQHEENQQVKAFMRKTRKLTDSINLAAGLEKFSASATETVEEKTFNK